MSSRGSSSARSRLVFIAAVVFVFLSSRGAAEAVPASGTVVVVGAVDGKPISGGAQDTPFSLRLPERAACPGDSEDGQYRVQSFIVPDSIDPGTLFYRGLRPVADGAWALYRTDTTTYMNSSTNKASTPGGEGSIINIPDLSFDVFEPGMIPPGRYHLGVACSLFAETKRYWVTDVAVVAKDGDGQGAFTWRLLNPPEDARGAGRSPVVALVASVAVVPLVFLLTRRRSGGRDLVDVL